MDKIDTLFKNPCFGKPSIGRNLKKHLELTSDVLLQNLSTQFEGINNSPVDSKAASSDEELLDDNVFMRHPRYFTEERESSLIPIAGATCRSLSINEKFTTEKRPIHISEESTFRPANKHGNKASVELVESPKTNSQVANTRITDDSNKVTENTADADIMDTKLNCTLLKISSQLQEISRIIYNGIQPIESDGDNSRRQKRVTEFFSRFTRNYLYQLVRQLSDARKLLGRPVSCRTTQSGSASSLHVQDKLATVCHTVVQALQAYGHHVPLTVTSSAHSKCLSLVAYIRELCKLLRKHLGTVHTASAVHTVEQHTHTLADAINTCLLVCTDDTGRGTRVSLATVSNKSTSTAARTTVPFHKRQSLDKRLAMYNNTSCGGWKRSATVLAKQRFNVQSRYKLGTYKPPMHSEARTCLTTVTGPPHLTATSKKSLGEKRTVRSPVNSHVDVDNIPTMVELELQKERQLKEQRAQRKHKHKTQIHTSTCSENDRVEPTAAPAPTAAEKPVHVARKKQEDNLKTILQYLLVQLQQQEQESSKEISSAAPAAVEVAVTAEEVVVGTRERSVMRTDNTATTANGRVFDKIKGLVAHVRGITDAPASSLHSSELDDKGARNTGQTQDNVQQSKTRIVTLQGAPNAKLICIKDKSCFETSDSDVDGVEEQCSSDSNETSRGPRINVNDQLQSDRNVVTELVENRETEPDVEEKIKELNWTEPKQIPDAIVDDIIEAVYADIQVDDVLHQLFTSEFI